jgi:diacylglycerol kinase family enzyme
MRFQRLLLIVNPVARTFSKPVLAVIEKALSADFRLEVTETKQRGHASEIARQAMDGGIDLVVVFSGDGTINEVLNALAGSETALGVLPGGATNILARALELPLDPVEAAGVLISKALDDDAFKLNLGRADGRYFAVNCGAGVDAAAMNRLDAKFPKKKATFDRAAFRAVAWELLVGYAGRRADLTVTVDDAESLAALSVMVGRTDPYTFYRGRGLRLTPEASLDEGLDVLSVRKLARRAIPRIAWQVFGSARHVHGRDIDYVHDASHVLITSEKAFPVQVDGDSMGDHKRLEVDLAREALWVVA